MNYRRSLAWLGLITALAFDFWLRGHTFGPALRDAAGFAPYLASSPESEPLDCDEAVYAYMGERIGKGAVLYRDLTENKPPLGYWVFALAVSIGGLSEITVRLLPIPFVLTTVALVWWIARRLRGPATGFLAASTYAVLSTDPYVYGNSANLEFLLNAFGTGSLALLIWAWDRPGRRGLAAAGVCVGAAALVKQVAALHFLAYAVALLARRTTHAGPRTISQRFRDLVWLAIGGLAPGLVAAAVLAAQGGLTDAWEDVVRYGSALATDTPPPPHAPPALVRWLTGNADPEGHLPWPFGTTSYLLWWGAGAWPCWIAAGPALLLVARRHSGPGTLVAIWSLVAWVEVALPGLFWAHYYLLPLPGIAVALAVPLGDAVQGCFQAGWSRWLARLTAVALASSLLGTSAIQFRDYLQATPARLTRFNGGDQWHADRALGRELRRCASLWRRPSLFVWGWQSPLYFYSGLPNASRQVFADDLIRHQAGKDHPLIGPRTERIMGELRSNRPPLIFTGYPPFPALAAFLRANYLPSRKARGLWVERENYGRFEALIGG